MSGQYWNLRCPWCDYYIVVFLRGMSGNDRGSGVETAEEMQRHVADVHQQTWQAFLRMPAPSPTPAGEAGE